MTRSSMLEELAALIAEIRLSHPLRVAINGVDGAGKTILADELVEPLRSHGREVIRASIDGFHNPRSVRYGRGRNSPEGYFRDSFDYAALRQYLLEPLGSQGSGLYRAAVFDWRTDSPVISPLKRAPNEAVVLIDGIFLLRPELMPYWDFTVFLDVREDIAIARCAARDGSSPDVNAATNRRYVEGQQLYFAECDPKGHADVVIDNNDLSAPVLISGSH